jgi:hypothetical protein
LEKLTLRAESILDGIFSEAIVAVEADDDRLVYHTTWETLAKELRLDAHFVAVGGTGGVADTCRLYRRLHIPVAVVADLDLIADPICSVAFWTAMVNKKITRVVRREGKGGRGSNSPAPAGCRSRHMRGPAQRTCRNADGLAGE